jgi:hypothetical protein
MFLHSGASLHGHEYSTRTSPATGQPRPRRNSLLRASFGTPINRALPSPLPSPSSPSPSPYCPSTSKRQSLPPQSHSRSPSPSPRPPPSALRRTRAASVEYFRATPESVVRFAVPEHVPTSATKLDAMSEDEASTTAVDVSDSDHSHAESLTRRRRRRSTKLSTSYLLAQAPPSLSKKQRLLHIRPRLLLQLQQFSAGQRPRPVIDVYPSLGIANTSIAAHLCKRLPWLSRIKKEVGIQDVLLIQSEDYRASTIESDGEGDAESIKNRELIAILSPLTGQDKAEIALSDGSVWEATPRANGSSLSYEFTTVTERGETITARWVRRPAALKPLQAPTFSAPPTPPVSAPTSPSSANAPAFPSPNSSLPLEHKFTFSIIDPERRRHPVLATLNPTSLEIQDTYATVSQSLGRYPPVSQHLPDQDESAEDKVPAGRGIQLVEEWQKSFIQISALWVALRHGWVPHFRPADYIPQSANSTANGGLLSPKASQNRGRSHSTGTEMPPRAMSWRCISGAQPEEHQPPEPGVLPRRAKSTGAARMQRLRTQKQLSGASEWSETDSAKANRRLVMSCDLSDSVANQLREMSIAESADSTASSGDSRMRHAAIMPTVVLSQASPRTSEGRSMSAQPSSRRAVSDYYPHGTVLFASPGEVQSSHPTSYVLPGPAQPPSPTTSHEAERRRHKWKNVTQWFSKIRSR